jgi:uncharacterized protein YgiM (DUF1202 family)
VIACVSFLGIHRPASADTDLVIGGEARVSYTGGDDIRVRSQPSTSGSVLTSVPEGWLVSVLDGPIADGSGNQWYQVVARGMTGYMMSDYLARPEGTSAGTVISSAWVIDGSLNLRASASTSASVLLVMPDGAKVGVTGSPQNGFTPVQFNGTNGWAYSAYLSSSEPGSGSSPGTVIANAWVIDGALNLRSSASTSSGVLLVMPDGAKVGVTGSAQNGFTPVVYNGTAGWAYSVYLSSTEPGSGSSPGIVISSAWVIDGALNMRASATTSANVLLVLPDGAKVGVTGSPQNGFTPVQFNGTNGWAYSAYLSATEPGSGSSPGTVTETRYATASLNMRSGAGMSFSIVSVIPTGAEVGVTGGAQNGYLPVRYNGADGFALASYLSGSKPSEPDPGSGVGSGLIVWPVKGGTWEIIQGYNGGTHQNRSSSASYYYSLDIAKVGGGTAGTPVYSPVTGTVLWTNGGLLIDMGNGYGAALFHITIDGSISSGTRLTQGQYVGFISGPGQTGYAVTPHIDFTLWRIPNGGGSPRYSTAFTGQFAISGQAFPDIGTWNMHGGTRFTP